MDRKKVYKGIRNNWIPFEGDVTEESNNTIVLSATDGSQGIIEVERKDFKQNWNSKKIRVGCKIKVKRTPVSSADEHTFKLNPINCQDNCSEFNKSCNSPDTYATGSAEFCCKYDINIGSADNFWCCRRK